MRYFCFEKTKYVKFGQLKQMSKVGVFLPPKMISPFLCLGNLPSHKAETSPAVEAKKIPNTDFLRLPY